MFAGSFLRKNHKSAFPAPDQGNRFAAAPKYFLTQEMILASSPVQQFVQ